MPLSSASTWSGSLLRFSDGFFFFVFLSLLLFLFFLSYSYIYPKKTKKVQTRQHIEDDPSVQTGWTHMNVWMYMDVNGCICKIPINIYSRVSIILHVLVELLAKNQALKTAWKSLSKFQCLKHVWLGSPVPNSGVEPSGTHTQWCLYTLDSDAMATL